MIVVTTGFLITIPIFALAISAAMTWYSSKPESFLYILDHPNERSLHEKPIPRNGGVAIVLSIAVGFLILCAVNYCTKSLLLISISMIIMSIISYVDDRDHLSVKTRLIGQFLCVLIVVANGVIIKPSFLPDITFDLPVWVITILTIVYIVWMINLYNFMDGMDGFASGMTIIGFTTFAIFGLIAGDIIFTISSVIIVAASTGFLIFNFPPARIFMGDSGSASLGLLAGAFSVWGRNADIFPFWIAVIIFSPFITDATITLIQRTFRKEKIWQAHKTHYYQRLVEMGWDHRKTVLFEYTLMLLCSLFAIIAMKLTTYQKWFILIVAVLMYMTLAYFVDKKYKSFTTEH